MIATVIAFLVFSPCLGLRLPSERPEGKYIVQAMWGKCDAGVFATRAMLNKYHSRAAHIVYIKSLPKDCEDLLRAANITLYEIPDMSLMITPSKLGAAAGFLNKFVLLQLPGLSPGARVVALDTDAVPAQNIDEMFDFITPENPFWAASDSTPTFQFNSGVMVYKKDEQMFDRLLNTIETIGDRMGDSDQDLLSYHFQVKEGMHSFLPGRYNSQRSNLVQNHRGRNVILDDNTLGPDGFAKIVHYTNGGFTEWCNQNPSLAAVARECCEAQKLLVTLGTNTLGLKNDLC